MGGLHLCTFANEPETGTPPAVRVRGFLAASLCLAAGLAGHVARVPAGEPAPRFEQRTYASSSGSRDYRLYVPSGYRGQRVRLVMALHGCGQDAVGFADDTGFNDLAERDTFIVAYPDQPSSANAGKCWNWFLPEHQRREEGEPSLLAGIARSLSAEFRISRRQTHVAGLSAGGAMAVLLGATYPDVFASIGVSAGLEYKAAEDLASSAVALQLGGPDPDGRGTLAYAAMADAARVVPAIVFHGDLDQTVRPVNSSQVIAQWAQTNDLADDGADDDSIAVTAPSVATGTVPGGRSWTRSSYSPTRRGPLLVKWIVHGMTHKWSGGAPGKAFTDPAGPDASSEMLRFFAAHSG